MTKYNSNFNQTYPFSDLAPQFALAANTELTLTIPGDNTIYYRAEFSWAYNANVWVSINSTATVPTAGTMSSDTRVELRPTVRYVRGGDVLHFISNAIVSDAGVALLELPN